LRIDGSASFGFGPIHLAVEYLDFQDSLAVGKDAIAKFPSESLRSAHLAYAALLVTLSLYDHEALRRSF
jgi:hypothetical protein